jgi:dihydrodiol dehydrogenase / D-xylose 1-dehydrogenase (NADP)
MQAVWSRCFPVYRRIKEEVQSGNLGEIRHVQAEFCFHKNEVERIAKPELGGGGLYDLGVYPVQLACMIYNNEKPEKITADATLSDQGSPSF